MSLHYATYDMESKLLKLWKQTAPGQDDIELASIHAEDPHFNIKCEHHGVDPRYAHYIIEHTVSDSDFEEILKNKPEGMDIVTGNSVEDTIKNAEKYFDQKLNEEVNQINKAMDRIMEITVSNINFFAFSSLGTMFHYQQGDQFEEEQQLCKRILESVVETDEGVKLMDPTLTTELIGKAEAHGIKAYVVHQDHEAEQYASVLTVDDKPNFVCFRDGKNFEGTNLEKNIEIEYFAELIKNFKGDK